MQSLFYLLIQILDLYWWIVIINVIISWLIGFNVLNTQNRFVFMIFDFTNRLTNPILNKIRNVLPNFGTIDASPVVLLLALWFIKSLMYEYLRPAMLG
jgi:YggT family protein|tara:strand:- start:204 stop:497 length:294 start_codon:yes stop_codon:yes gene_type:complete